MSKVTPNVLLLPYTGLAVNFEIILTEITNSAVQMWIRGLPPFLVLSYTPNLAPAR